MGPSQRASIAINFESPFPIASFLNIYLVKRLKVSKIKNDIKEAPTPLITGEKSINLPLNILKNINPKTPKQKPKFLHMSAIGIDSMKFESCTHHE